MRVNMCDALCVCIYTYTYVCAAVWGCLLICAVVCGRHPREPNTAKGVAGCCSVMQCVAVCCSVLQRVAECCSVLPTIY